MGLKCTGFLETACVKASNDPNVFFILNDKTNETPLRIFVILPPNLCVSSSCIEQN